MHVYTYYLGESPTSLSSKPFSLNTVVWEKFSMKKFSSDATKIKHTKIFLPQRNRVFYNGS